MLSTITKPGPQAKYMIYSRWLVGVSDILTIVLPKKLFTLQQIQPFGLLVICYQSNTAGASPIWLSLTSTSIGSLLLDSRSLGSRASMYVM